MDARYDDNGHRAQALQVGLLGSFQVRTDGAWQAAPTKQVARVGTVLAGWPGEPVDRDRIIRAVWGDSPPATATNTLQVHISHLRRLVGKDLVKSTPNGYLLDVAAPDVDAERFLAALQEAARLRRRRHYRRASEQLLSALRLWRGVPYQGVVDPDLEARRVRFAELREQAREDLLECRIELADDQFSAADAVAQAKELVARHPERQRCHVMLVRALAAAGRTGEAIAAFESAQHQLQGTRGVEPGPELVALHNAILTIDPRVAPRATSTITNVPHLSRIPTELEGVAAVVREAVVDDGASLVTVIRDEASPQWASLAVSIATTMQGDLMTGVLMLDSSDPSMPAIDSALERASAGRVQGLAEVHDVDGLAIMCEVPEGSQAAELAGELARWPAGPCLIVISGSAVGLPGEVIIDAQEHFGADVVGSPFEQLLGA